LRRLDARGNCLGALQDLAVLAGCPHLQELSLQGAPPASRRACLLGSHMSKEASSSRCLVLGFLNLRIVHEIRFENSLAELCCYIYIRHIARRISSSHVLYAALPKRQCKAPQLCLEDRCALS